MTAEEIAKEVAKCGQSQECSVCAMYGLRESHIAGGMKHHDPVGCLVGWLAVHYPTTVCDIIKQADPAGDSK